MMKSIDTFLSHADKDKELARKLADELEKHDFQVFVAHDKIKIGEEWETVLLKEIEKCELFIALLSDNFRKASFTEQEVGIAHYLKKRIFPIRIDNTMPYGFMSKYQAKKISPEINAKEVATIVKQMISDTESGQQLVDYFIKKFEDAYSFHQADNISSELFNYTSFTPEQINRIAIAYILNDQIRKAWQAGPKCVNFLVNNWDSVTDGNKKKLERIFNQNLV